MTRVAKLFANDRSQAVRLPKDFRFTGAEVFIRKDPASGDVILSPKPGNWDEFFQLREELADEIGDFLADRGPWRPQNRDPLA